MRVVSVTEDDGSWRAWLGTDPEASVAAVVQVALACWGIEPHYHDLKEGASLEPVPWRRVLSNVGAWNLNLWVHPGIEVGAWGRSASTLSDRRDRPWDDAHRRPSPADRRRAVQGAMREEEFERISIPLPWTEKIRPRLEGVVRIVA